MAKSEVEHVARVVMAYTFMDVDTAEEITVKVAGEGLDAGDKAPYKAMTGALKYALLQSFLLATGDDPENEPAQSHYAQSRQSRTVTEQEAKAIYELVEKTGTELERVLEYYKVSVGRGDDGSNLPQGDGNPGQEIGAHGTEGEQQWPRVERILQNTPEWHAWRMQGLGSSDAPVIMQESPWRTPKQIWELEPEGEPSRKTPILHS